MAEQISSNKRIAKNTVILYIRTIVILFVSLYTSRVILRTLGVVDYGINNVVGGLVSMFSVISSSLSSSVSRYITYELGTGNWKKLKVIFQTSVNIQLVLALIIVVIGSFIGYWFVNNKMSVPIERLYAANWVLFSTLISFAISLLNVPFSSCIISHEKMDAFAYISIAETILKLAIAFLITFSSFDKLITYTILYLISTFLIFIIYVVYCKVHFKECEYDAGIDKAILKDMSKFAGWNFFGSTAYILNTQGVNMLINVFFGVQINAARAIGVQVQNAIMQFVNNFTTAVNPQITKSYACQDYEHFYRLVCQGAKYSYFLLLIFTVPIFVEAEAVLKLWLGIVPEYSVIFLRLIILSSYTNILGNTSYTAIMATGNIRNYQIVITLVGFLVFPLTWILYKLGYSVETTYYTYIIIYSILIFIRIYFLKVLVKLPPVFFIRYVLVKVLILTIPAFFIPFLFINYYPASLLRIVLTCMISLMSNLILIYYWGLSKGEREFITIQVKQKLNHKL